MGQKSVGRLHRRLDVLQTSYPPSPSWIQDGDAGNDVIQDLGRVFRSLLRCAVQNGGPSASGRHLGWPHLRVPEMRSSKMATGSGRAAILHRAPQWGSKNPPYTTTAALIILKSGTHIGSDSALTWLTFRDLSHSSTKSVGVFFGFFLHF